jgi:alkylation response protein AidB-like acyl-CoA dehydrogenase
LEEFSVKLLLTDDSRMLKETFERFFAAESSSERVRKSEPLGFDAVLWRDLAALGAPVVRLQEARGGGGLGVFETTLMMHEAGRRLASAPLAEVVVALRVLGEIGDASMDEWLARAASGEALITLALQEVRDGERQLVPGGAVADAILFLPRGHDAVAPSAGQSRQRPARRHDER